jgi:hypothetical protein
LKDFTATFFEKNTLLKVLLHYSVFDVSDTLLVMRPYQIAATERILQKVISSYQAKIWSKAESGGYIWHTTGSGQDSHQLQSGPPRHGTGIHRQGVLCGGSQGSGLPDHEGIPALLTRTA